MFKRKYKYYMVFVYRCGGYGNFTIELDHRLRVNEACEIAKEIEKSQSIENVSITNIIRQGGLW